MLYSLLQQPIKAAVLSTATLSTVLLAALPGFSQNLGDFGGGSARTFGDRSGFDVDRSFLGRQSLGSDVICGNDFGQVPSRQSQTRYRARGRFDFDSYSNQDRLSDDPLVPNRLNAQPSDTRRSQVESGSNRVVNCQMLQNASITTINQPLANQSVSVTINNGSVRSARSVTSGRLAGDGKLPLSVIANLPDGNYRVTSLANARSDIGTAELANRGGRLFTFNKSGDRITGNLNDLDGGFNACITGNVEGDIVTGTAITDDVGADVLGRNFLDLGLTLELGNQVAGDRYSNSVLNLSGFSRINAGTVTPPRGC